MRSYPRCMGWINRDKLSFLINTLEWQESSLGDIVDALGRFQALEMEERELPQSLLNVLKAALLRTVLHRPDRLHQHREAVRHPRGFP